MSVVEHCPPKDFEPGHLEPVLFLAGPIQGAADWQSEAVKIARERWTLQTPLHIANPRWIAKPNEFNKSAQITWEKKYLKRAAMLGALVFYLCAESADAPAPNRAGRAYAQTTRQEFGRAAGWIDYDHSVLVSVGMEEGYRGNEDYYRHTADELNMTIHNNLEATVSEAIENILFRNRFVLGV